MYSSVYHKTKLRKLKEGLAKEEASKFGREAAQKAVAEMEDVENE